MSGTCLLDVILAPGGLSVVFQPIFDARQTGLRVHSLECFTRGPRGTNLEQPAILFEYARRKRAEVEVDRAHWALALGEASRLPGTPDLSLNVHASTLARDRGFADFLVAVAEICSVSLSRLTMEIVEHSPAWDGPAFLRALERVRKLGVRIALDDIGLGQPNYRRILDCRPDYFKIDGYFVRGAHADFHRRAVLESVALLAEKFGARAVAEGIEEMEDLRAVLAQGIDLVQGYLLSPVLPRAELIRRDLLHFPVFSQGHERAMLLSNERAGLAPAV